jgi:hypothetical protein
MFDTINHVLKNDKTKYEMKTKVSYHQRYHFKWYQQSACQVINDDFACTQSRKSS